MPAGLWSLAEAAASASSAILLLHGAAWEALAQGVPFRRRCISALRAATVESPAALQTLPGSQGRWPPPKFEFPAAARPSPAVSARSITPCRHQQRRSDDGGGWRGASAGGGRPPACPLLGHAEHRGAQAWRWVQHPPLHIHTLSERRGQGAAWHRRLSVASRCCFFCNGALIPPPQLSPARRRRCR